jgi:hypothetical protein
MVPSSMKQLCTFFAGVVLLAGTAYGADKYWSGSGTWDTTTANWGLAPGGPYNQLWADGDSANFEGTAGTVTVAENIVISNLTVDVDNYLITGNALLFASGGSLTVNSSGAAGNYGEACRISCAISNTPAVFLNTPANTETVFAPASGSVSLGTIGGGGLIQMDGSTTGNTIASGSSSKLRLSGGEWTLLGNAAAYQHFADAGTLIVNGQLTSNSRQLKVSVGATLSVIGTIGNGNANGIVFSGNTEGFSGSPGGTLKGTGIINQSTVLDVLTEATIAPGDPTGTLNVKSNSCIIRGNLDITVDGDQNSLLTVGGSLSLSNATLNVASLNTPAQAFVIATYDSLSGTFGTTNLPRSDWAIDYNYNSANQIAVIPPARGTVIMLH